MATIQRMGRRKLGRVKRNITLPPDLAEKADDVSAHMGKPLGTLIEVLIEPYITKHWTEAMRPPPRKPKRAK